MPAGGAERLALKGMPGGWMRCGAPDRARAARGV